MIKILSAVGLWRSGGEKGKKRGKGKGVGIGGFGRLKP